MTGGARVVKQTMMRFEIEGDITIRQAQSVAQIIAKNHGDRAEVTLRGRAPFVLAAEPLHELLGIAGPLAVMISACVTFLMAYRQVRQRHLWTIRRFKTLIEEEMADLGVTDHKLKSLRNFRSLKERRNAPCVAIVADQRSGDEYKVYVFKEGKAYVLRVSS